MKTKLMIATAILTGTLAIAGTAGASGTTNGQSGCVAQVIASQGPPGPVITDIKTWYAAAPGQFISLIGRSPKTNCLIP